MEPSFQGTVLQELVKNVIYGFSGLGMGCAVYMAWLDAKAGLHVGKGHRRRLLLARAGFVSCFFGIVLLLTTLIYQTHRPISLAWQTIVYTFLIVAAGMCALGMAWESRKLRREEHA